MNIIKYEESHLPILFQYWHKIGVGVPYFFPVSIERWRACLFDDELLGEQIFGHLEHS